MIKLIQTVDILAHDEDENVLLIERAKAPFEDKFVLPGGHVESGESFVCAAVRELSEEACVHVTENRLRSLCVLDAPDRDPRPGQRVSHVFAVKVTREELESARAQSDARSVQSVNLSAITSDMMGFDHYLAIQALRKELGHESD